jgi:HEAT repeat protein
MWRRGDIAYAVLVLGTLLVETAALFGLSLAFILRRASLVSGWRAFDALVLATGATALVLVVLASYVLAYHHASELLARRTAARVADGIARWTGVLVGTDSPPAAPLSRAARDALLALREITDGAEGDRLARLIVDRGVANALLRQLRSRRVTRQLEALEALARARIPCALPHLYPLLAARDHVTRMLAARAAAHTLAAMPRDGERVTASREFARALRGPDVAPGVVAEALLLSEDGAADLIRQLWERPRARRAPLAASLDAIGRLKLLDLVALCVDSLAEEDPELRAAALRAFARLGHVPAAARAAVVVACGDPVAFVRVQAARAVALVDTPATRDALLAGLGDRSWWVRLAAAQALLARGAQGAALLRLAAAAHPDRYGRDMARQVLADAAMQRRAPRAA